MSLSISSGRNEAIKSLEKSLVNIAEAQSEGAPVKQLAETLSDKLPKILARSPEQANIQTLKDLPRDEKVNLLTQKIFNYAKQIVAQKFDNFDAYKEEKERYVAEDLDEEIKALGSLEFEGTLDAEYLIAEDIATFLNDNQQLLLNKLENDKEIKS